MNIKKLFVVPVLLISFVFSAAPLQAVELPVVQPLPINEPGEFNLPGTIRDTAKSFKITDSEYLNISVDSSEIIDARIESIPHMILMHLEPSATATSSTITISNLEPNTTYWWHQDTHRSLTPFTTTSSGSYTYTQDLSESHLVFIKPEPSTKYISDNATGGDCTAIGIWDSSTRTCTLTSNVTETIEIDDNEITLDGNKFSLIKTGLATGYGVFINGHDHATIKNLNIAGFGVGIYVSGSYSSISSNNITNNEYGIYGASNHNSINDNNAFKNATMGIRIIFGSNNSLNRNTIINNCNGLSISNNSLTMTANVISSRFCSDGFDFRFEGGDYDSTGNSIDDTNTINGKPIYYLQDISDAIYENAGAFYCIRCDNVILQNSTIESEDGIILWRTNNSKIKEVFSSNAFAPYLFSSDNNTITKSTFIDSYGATCLHLESSDDNTFYMNTLDCSGSYIVNAAPGSFLYESNNNKFFNNNFILFYPDTYNSQGNVFSSNLPNGGNYYGEDIWNAGYTSKNCSDTNSDNICDNPYVFLDGQDNFPWKIQDGWLLPAISNISQYKSDNITEIDLGGKTTESWINDPTKGIISFKANVSDPRGDWVKLEVEVKPAEPNSDFNGTDTIFSELAPSGSEVVAQKADLTAGKYKWRARVVDSSGTPIPVLGVDGNKSGWYDFGNNGNSADFEIKLVPLYTQVDSDYPLRADADEWANLDYNNGQAVGGCGAKIRNCGCAITSVVMVMRYHNATTDVANLDVNPKSINAWLQNSTNKGYDEDSNLKWGKLKDYSNNQVSFNKDDSYDTSSNKLTTLNGYLDNNNPMIAYQSDVPYLNSRLETKYTPHFIVIDNRLGLSPNYTYNVKDPSWFGTRTLNDTEDRNNRVKAYGGTFTSLRVVGLYNPAHTQKNITVRLGSPAELLITDPNGDRIGKDPVTGTEYNEIADAYYYEEGIGDPTGEVDGPFHLSKFVSIPTAIDGDYQIQVIGSGDGPYTVESDIYDSNGDSHSEIFHGNIITGLTTEYTLEFDDTTPLNIDISPDDQTAPTTTISISGTQVNGWYTSGALVTLSASDNASGVGVWKTEYSLDGGITWNTYTAPFIPPDADNLEIRYRSEDYVGNLESYGSATIDVDQTGPEAQVYFDTVDKKIKVDGVDNLSTPTVNQIDPLNYTITDHVGHTLELGFTYPISTYDWLMNKNVYSISVRKIKYNNDYKFVPVNTLSFGIKTDLSNNIKLLEQLIDVPTKFNISGAYDGYGTKIVSQRGINVDKEYSSGLKLIKLLVKISGLDFTY